MYKQLFNAIVPYRKPDDPSLRAGPFGKSATPNLAYFTTPPRVYGEQFLYVNAMFVKKEDTANSPTTITINVMTRNIYWPSIAQTIKFDGATGEIIGYGDMIGNGLEKEIVQSRDGSLWTTNVDLRELDPVTYQVIQTIPPEFFEIPADQDFHGVVHPMVDRARGLIVMAGYPASSNSPYVLVNDLKTGSLIRRIWVSGPVSQIMQEDDRRCFVVCSNGIINVVDYTTGKVISATRAPVSGVHTPFGVTYAWDFALRRLLAFDLVDDSFGPPINADGSSSNMISGYYPVPLATNITKPIPLKPPRKERTVPLLVRAVGDAGEAIPSLPITITATVPGAIGSGARITDSFGYATINFIGTDAGLSDVTVSANVDDGRTGTVSNGGTGASTGGGTGGGTTGTTGTTLAVPTGITNGATVTLSRNTVYQGTLDLSGKTGVNVVASAGTGSPPVISTGKAVAGWAIHSGNIYKAAVDFAPSQVSISDVPVKRASWPVTVPDWATSTAGMPGTDVIGATLYQKTNKYTITATVLSDNSVPTDLPFYLEGKLWMITGANAWAYENGFLYVWTPDGATPEGRAWASPEQVAINCDNSSGVTINGVNVILSGTGVSGAGSTNLVVKNSTIKNLSKDGIFANGSTGFLADNVVVTNARGTGINGYHGSNTFKVQNSNISNSGMVGNPSPSNGGIYCGPSTGTVVTNNTVTHSAYSGINVNGNVNGSITNNTVDGFCLTMTDGGGIYTQCAGGTPSLNMTISSNSVKNGLGYQVMGIYLDDGSNGVTVIGNTLDNCDTGVMLHDSFSNTVRNNTFLKSTAQHFMFANSNGTSNTHGNTLKFNTMTLNNNEYAYNLSAGSNFPGWATWSSNTYTSNGTKFAHTFDGGTTDIEYTYQSWLTMSGETGSTMNGAGTAGGGAGGDGGGSAPSGQPVAVGSQIAPLSVQNTSTSAATNQPFAIGHVFAQGHLPSSGAAITLHLPDGSQIAAQLNVRATHADGSVRHAMVSGVIPSIAGGAIVPLSMKRASSASAGASVSLPTSLPSAKLVIGGVQYTATPTSSTPHTTWFAGPVASDYIFNMPFVNGSGTPHPTLTAQFSVRVFSTGHVRVDYVVEHCKAYASTTDITYDATLYAGGTSVYTKAALVHTPAARWKRTFWIGTAPTLHLRHDTAYLIASKAVPNYDQRITVSESLLAGYATALGNGKFVPMGFGTLMAAMATTGGRPDIGLMPDTHAAWVLSMDKRAKDIALGNADIGGTWPACRRDDSTGPGAGYPLSVINFPYATILGGGSDGINPTTGKNEHLPTLSTATQAGWDSSHQPGIFYLPYLLTGDYYYLEGLHFWCMANIYQSNPNYRNKGQGLIEPDQVRGQGWSIRTLAECAYVTPSDHPLKSAFDYFVETNFTWYNQHYTDGTNNVLGVITGSAFAYNSGRGLAPWQDDFFVQALNHAVELLDNSAAKRFLMWKSKFQVSRILGDGTCIMDAANYDLNCRDSSTSPYYTTIGQCMAATIPTSMSQYACNSPQRLATASSPNLQPGDLDGYPDSTQGYPANMQPALAAAVDVGYPQATTAWATFDARPTKPDYSTGPQFAIVPR